MKTKDMTQDSHLFHPNDPCERWAFFIILTFTLVAYLNSFQGDFILDDHASIRQNQSIRRIWPISIPLSPPRQTSVAGRPILNLTFALNYAIGGLDVRIYHLFNLAIHASAALLLYGIIRRTLRSFQNRFQEQANRIAMISALIWAVHPLQTESVTYIIQRSESLAGLFFLGTLYCAIRSSGSKKINLWTIAAIILCALGICVKEVAAMSPAVILLYDYIFLSDSWRRALRRRIALYIGLACTWALLPIVSLGARSGSTGFNAAGYGPISYGMTQIGVITHYLRLCFLPHPLVFDYFWVIEKSPAAVILPGLLLGGILGFTVCALLRKSPLGFPGAWFFLILAPTSSIFPIHTEVAAERRMYLPLAAVVVPVVILFYCFIDFLGKRWISFKPHKSIAVSILVFVCVSVLGIMTIMRNLDYQDPERMWKLVLREQPQNCRAYLNLGIFYLEHGRKQDAIIQYEKALEYTRNSSEIAHLHANLAHLLLDQEQYEKAWMHFEKAISADPRDEVFMIYFGIDLGRRGRIVEAESVFRRALEVNPRNCAAHNNLGRTLEMQDRNQEAMEHYQESMKLNPEFPDVYRNLGNLLSRQGRKEEAMQLYEKALRLRPNWLEVHNALVRLQQEKNNQQNTKR
jgi:Tfp pilus assembly protein PilF